MSWFWGRSKNDDDEEEEEEDYSSAEEDEDHDYDSDVYTDDDDIDDDVEEDEKELSTTRQEDTSRGALKTKQKQQDGSKNSTDLSSSPASAVRVVSVQPSSGPEMKEKASSSGGNDLGSPWRLLGSPRSKVNNTLPQCPVSESISALSTASEEEEEDIDDDDSSLIPSEEGPYSKDDYLVEESHPPAATIEGMDQVVAQESAVSQGVVERTRLAHNGPATKATMNTTPPNDKKLEEEDGPTTFWEKQSLLVLAAEHDRVDILRGILSDDDGDRSRLMNSGIPPLHLAIHFASVNTTQTLLRMGADPSIRPNVKLILEQAKEAPEGQTLEIPKIERLDGVTAWELAFGNQAYQEQQQSQSKTTMTTRWSMFNTSSSNLDGANDRIIVRPVDMAPSKREGIRHAFTAEALRCIGGDEVDRLGQLLDSGMPPSIDVGGKDLYEWAVQLGGLKCEEFLRPVEALKHRSSDVLEDIDLSSVSEIEPAAASMNGTMVDATSATARQRIKGGKVIDRPRHEMTVPLLVNRLDELESLAMALSTCLDSLAEEVSVCHGLLLMGGGASALAAHVKSLKTLQGQRREQLEAAQLELENSELELGQAIHVSGAIGEEVAALASSTVLQQQVDVRNHAFEENDSDLKKRQHLLAQIAASENKIMKLRASIADLSEENVKEMEQVEQRGLLGGINLVRNLRDELRDLEYQWSSTKNRTATCRAQIGMIHARMPKSDAKEPRYPSLVPVVNKDEVGNESMRSSYQNDDQGIAKRTTADSDGGSDGQDESTTQQVDERNSQGSSPVRSESKLVELTTVIGDARKSVAVPPKAASPERPPAKAIPGRAKTKVTSDRISSGDSQAIVVRPPGNRGFFPLDLWQVLLRIVGFNHAAAKRAIQVANKKRGTPANIMIV